MAYLAPVGGHAVAFGITDEVVEHSRVGVEQTVELCDALYGINLFPVAVGILHGIAVEDVSSGYLHVIGRHFRGVERNEKVGHDAPAAVDRLAAGRHELQTVVEVDAVCREKFVVQVTIVDVVSVRAVGGCIRLLDGAARGRVVAGRGQPDGRTVRKWYLLLDEPLSVGAAADYRGAVVVLQSPGEYLARGGAVLVDEHGQLYILIAPFPVAVLLHPVAVAVFRIDDEPAVGEEFVRHADGLSEVTARIAAQVDYQFAHPFPAEFAEGAYHFVVGVLREGGDAQETDVGSEHVGGIHAFHRYLVAHDGDGNEVVYSLALDGYRYLRTARSAQHLHHVVHRKFPSGHERVVDADYPVAVLYARLLARPLRNDIQYDDGIGGHVERDAYAVEFPFERHVYLGQFRGGDIDRVGVEVPHEVGHQRLHERVGTYRVHVVAVYQREGVTYLAARRIEFAGQIAQPPVHAVAAGEETYHHA